MGARFPRVSDGGRFVSRGHLALSEDIFGYPAGELPLAVSD